jgi:hypothetical protein
MTRISELLDTIAAHCGINDKAKLTNIIAVRFGLIKDRSVYYCSDFAIRFSSGSGLSFSNTVLSLSNLKKVDHIPFLVCLVTPSTNYVMLANSTFLRKISHSSQQLRFDNIKGSFNGSDIIRDFEGISNDQTNIQRLFDIHREIGFDENLPRLVEATNNIVPTGHKFVVLPGAESRIMSSPARAARFVASQEALILKKELDDKVKRFKNEILVASLIENVNVRGRIIEYLIAGDDESLRQQLVTALQNRDTANGIPAFKTDNTLGDYQRIFDEYFTETDVKTKIMVLSRIPKPTISTRFLIF